MTQQKYRRVLDVVGVEIVLGTLIIGSVINTDLGVLMLCGIAFGPILRLGARLFTGEFWE